MASSQQRASRKSRWYSFPSKGSRYTRILSPITQNFAAYLYKANNKIYNGYYSRVDLGADRGEPVYAIVDEEIVKISKLRSLDYLVAPVITFKNCSVLTFDNFFPRTS